MLTQSVMIVSVYARGINNPRYLNGNGGEIDVKGKSIHKVPQRRVLRNT